ncbi:MAG: DUF885 family protein, partial [Elusimicrobiaceae bacterium]|nr:DUF885 family protein [Elusimicrobiaceae bacterium]
MKKLFSLGLALSILVTPLQALDISAYGDVDTIMEDNALSDVATRYSAVQLSFFPEYATRLGFNTAEDRLDRRDNERDAQALRALKLVQEGLNKINRKQLSEPKRTEYDMLQNMIEYDLYNLNRNRNMQDPLLYSSVFDALYDLRMKQINYTDVQKRDLAARLAMLPDVAHQAQNNLSTPPSFLSQIAMEKAYYAYLSFDEMEQYLVAQVSDDTAKAQLKRLTKESKTAIKDLFDLFKKTAQENTDKDFRLGSKKYETILKNRYSINQSESAMSKYLQKNLRAAQQELLYAINRFPVVEETVVVTEESTPAATTATEEVEVVSAPEEMVSGETAQNAETAAAENTSQKQAEPEKQAAKPQPKKPSAKKVKKPTTATAIDFYPIADRVTANVPQQQQNFISAFSTEATKLNQMFTREDILPMASASFKIRQMPAYYAYFKAYMFLPPFGTQTNPSHDLFLRLPAGSEETKAAMIA